MEIKGWELKNETVLEIGRFAILWNCFEGEWCNNNCTPAVIKEQVGSIQLDMCKQAKLASVLNERRNWFGQLEVDYVEESLHPGNARKSSRGDVEIMRRFLEQSGDDLTCGCLLVIHRIRNNLVHGLKSIYQLDDQIELFRSANEVLESIRWKE